MKQFIATLIFIVMVTPAWATTPVGSREYKLMLDPSAFNGSDPSSQISNFWNDLVILIDNELARPTSGSFVLDHDRTVQFYDTPSSCLFYNNNLIFRERIENGAREVTLKYRSPDRFLSHHQDMSGSGSSATTKFEEDISAPFVSKYSHSTTQDISAGKNLNRLDDPIGLYPGLVSYQFDDTLAIVLVGNLSIAESVYSGPEVDLGNENAAFSLTLWYSNGTTTQPVIAEISYKYKDPGEDYSENVVTRAKILFEAMQTMSGWLAPSATTKTAFVYNYDPAFCQ